MYESQSHQRQFLPQLHGKWFEGQGSKNAGHYSKNGRAMLGRERKEDRVKQVGFKERKELKMDRTPSALLHGIVENDEELVKT